MKLANVYGAEYGIGKPTPERPDGIKVYGVAVGSDGPGQSCFIVPIRGINEAEVDEAAWGIEPTTSGKPRLVANADPAPGIIIFLTAYNRPGKRLGRIWVIDDTGQTDHLTSVGYGMGGVEDGAVTWEEALVCVRAPTRFLLNHVGPPDAIVTVDPEKGVTTQEYSNQTLIEQLDADLIRLDDPRILRWRDNARR